MFAKLFYQKFAASIIAFLTCFDRVIFKGYLPFRGERNLNSLVDCRLRIKRKDFILQLEKYSQQLVDHAQQMARQYQRPYQYIQGKFRKETYIQELIKKHRIQSGLVAVLCVQEHCKTIKLQYQEKRPRLIYTRRPQRVLYYYWLDDDFGLMYVRLQTWFPYDIQIYVNGHHWLAQQMTRKALGFVQRDNAFVQLDDPQRAQDLADQFAKLPWVRQLNRWALMANPLLRRGGWLHALDANRYYWVTDQAEYATDVLFNKGTLQQLYCRLLDHATVHFSAKDIMTFLGRKLHGNFQGDLITKSKKQRNPGARIKHRMKENWLKMYTKFGCILRVETVINQPREFRVRRRRMRRGHQKMVWCPMNKGVVNLPAYARVASAANQRYLNALSTVDDPSTAYQNVKELVGSKQVAGRRYAGFNPACPDHVALFQALLAGEYVLRGFRNADIRAALYPPPRDPKQQRRQANALTRLFKRLHVRRLIAKIPRTRRWRLTARGRKLLGIIVQLHYHGLANAA